MPEDTPEPVQDGAVEVTYETLGDLVQRFHDHTETIPVHCIQVIEGVQREKGLRIVGVESVVTTLTKRVAELERITRGSEAPRVVELQRSYRTLRNPLPARHITYAERAEADTTALWKTRRGLNSLPLFEFKFFICL
ncbi:hypothetical protein Tco_1257886 [Tanacetum coccineum]